MKRSIVHLLVVIVLSVVCYSNTFTAPFIWDDIRLIQKNPFVRDIHFPVESLNTLNGGNGSPRHKTSGAFDDNEELYKTIKQRSIGCLTFALNYKLDRFHVPGYHLFNLIVHIANGILVYLFVLLTFSTPFLINSRLFEKRTHVALFCSLFFIAHPVQTNAVTYIYQRFASLATVFSLLSFVFYIKWRLSALSGEHARAYLHSGRQKPSKRSSWGWYVCAVLSLVLGMKTKENTFTVPFVIGLYEFTFFHGPIRKRLTNMIPVCMASLIVPLTFLVSMGRGFGQIAREYDFMNYGRIDYLLTQFRVLITYIRLIFWPVNLTLDYDYPVYTSFWDPSVYLAFLAHSGIICFSVFLLLRSRAKTPELRMIAFGIWWFYFFNAMESSIITFSQVILEYRIYMPMLGFIISTITGLYFLQKTYFPTGRIVLSVLLGLLLVMLSGATYARNDVWSDEARFWEDNVKKSPGRFVPYFNLGLIYKKQGRLEEAIKAFQAVSRLKPSLPDSYAALGEVYRMQGDSDKAIKSLELAITINPDLVEAHRVLGIIYDDLGRFDDAVKEFNIALSIDPNDVKTHIDLGISFMRQGRRQSAVQDFLSVVSLEPDNIEAHTYLGMVYEELDLPDEAVRELQAALALDPERQDIRNELGAVLQVQEKRYRERR